MRSTSIQELAKDKSNILVVSPIFRPGVRLFAAKLEYGHFPPRTTLNDLFNIVIVPWKGMNFYVVVLPKDTLALAKEIAKSINMEVNEDLPAVPLHVGGRISYEFFPIKGDNVHSLVGSFDGDEEAEVAKLIKADSAKMQRDFSRVATVKAGPLDHLDFFVAKSYEVSYYGPTIAIMFGGKRRATIDSLYIAYIVDDPFGAATVSKDGELLGLFIVPTRRGWGYGTRLLTAACNGCQQKGQRLKINPLSKKMTNLVAKLPKDLQNNIQLESFVAKDDIGELDDLFYKELKWFMPGSPGNE